MEPSYWIIICAASATASFVLGWFFSLILGKSKLAAIKQQAEDIIEDAQRKAQNIKKDAAVKSKEKFQNLKAKLNSDSRERENKLRQFEERVGSREKELREKVLQVTETDRKAQRHERSLRLREKQIEEKEQKIDGLYDEQLQRLEQISSLSIEEAKKLYLENIEHRSQREAAELMLQIKTEAREKAVREAKWILSDAIERLASDHTSESTLTVVELPNDRIKGAIIGREGRNIKAFENATGVKVIIDDTPECVVLSGYDPVKREIARQAMEQLVRNPNIQPQYVESVVEKARKTVEKTMREAADRVLKDLKIDNVKPEMREMLSKLHYRTSYGQNVLQHSKEVSLLSGNMAAELGLDEKLARRAGLFHDIGKGISNDVEGSHVTIGVDVTTRCGEHEVVTNAVLAHHDEAEPIHPISVLVTAADIISGSRPGARRESVEAYSQRIENLEKIAEQFDGVSKVYAIYAGREIRIVAEADRLDDAEAALLSSEIAAKIQAEMQYPGQIKIVVIRERKIVRYTDDKSALKSDNGELEDDAKVETAKNR